MKQMITLPQGAKKCPHCGGTPIFSEDSTIELPFRAECLLHPEMAAYVLGGTLEAALLNWNDDDSWVALGAKPR